MCSCFAQDFHHALFWSYRLPQTRFASPEVTPPAPKPQSATSFWCAALAVPLEASSSNRLRAPESVEIGWPFSRNHHPSISWRKSLAFNGRRRVVVPGSLHATKNPCVGSGFVRLASALPHPAVHPPARSKKPGLLADYFQSAGLWMAVSFGSRSTGGNWWRGTSARGSGRQVTPMRR